MQEEEEEEAASSSYASRDDLESPRVAAVEQRPDLVASLVHVNRLKLPLSTTTTTTTSVRTESATPRQAQFFNHHHQYVVPQVDKHHHLQVSQIAAAPSTKISIASSICSPHDSPALDKARLIEPFSPVLRLCDSDPEENRSAPIDQCEPSVNRSATTTTTTTATTNTIPQGYTPNLPNALSVLASSPNPIELEGIDVSPTTLKNRMFFGELQRNSAAAHRRRSMATTSALTDYEADLTSKDRMKQKDAIKRLLAGKIREDWDWTWPRDGDEPGTPIVNRSRESLVEEDWKERDEWISNASESENESGATVGTPTIVVTPNSKDPFRFDSPDGVGDTLRKTTEDRKARRRRRLQEEMRVNDGLSCFTHRRNAWTCARHVRRVPRASVNTTPLKRTLSRPTSKPSPMAPVLSTQTNEDDFLDIITEVRIAPPILPPETPMRKGINERAYATIYDKVVLQSQTPFCPINLSVVTKSCVEGWKRDGEWPPKSGEMEGIIASVRRANLGGNASIAKDTEGGDGVGGSKSKSVLRRSLQKVMGAVRERAGSKGKEGEVVLKE